MTDLWYQGERNDVADYLGSHGWMTAATSLAELFAANGIAVRTDDEDEAAMSTSFTYVTATRT
jgi:hypothetical protein